MARTRTLSTGIVQVPKTFMMLFCAAEQLETPHLAGRVISEDAPGVRLKVRCRRCGAVTGLQLPQLPEGHRVYQVRITGEDGPHMPAEYRPLPYLEESFSVVATSAQDAHERADFAHTLRLAGQLTRYYIDGLLHLDERF